MQDTFARARSRQAKRARKGILIVIAFSDLADALCRRAEDLDKDSLIEV